MLLICEYYADASETKQKSKFCYFWVLWWLWKFMTEFISNLKILVQIDRIMIMINQTHNLVNTLKKNKD